MLPCQGTCPNYQPGCHKCCAEWKMLQDRQRVQRQQKKATPFSCERRRSGKRFPRRGEKIPALAGRDLDNSGAELHQLDDRLVAACSISFAHSFPDWAHSFRCVSSPQATRSPERGAPRPSGSRTAGLARGPLFPTNGGCPETGFPAAAKRSRPARAGILITLVRNYTSWMIAISAASPRRGPMRTTRV